METLMSAVIGALSGKASREVIVFIISMIPILELRGGLLAASVLIGVQIMIRILLNITATVIGLLLILLIQIM